MNIERVFINYYELILVSYEDSINRYYYRIV